MMLLPKERKHPDPLRISYFSLWRRTPSKSPGPSDATKCLLSSHLTFLCRVLLTLVALAAAELMRIVVSFRFYLP